MPLSIRPKVYSLPSYSLTGDLLGFIRCGLQYRYTRIGKLPPSRPVQLWFGEFIHGVLEEGYRIFDQSRKKGIKTLPPWSKSIIDDICRNIKGRLDSRGLIPWDPDLETLGYQRAKTAINDLGPHLFPLIHRAEVRLTGARLLPTIPKSLQFRVADRYEMVGVIDVVTHVQLSDLKITTNPIVRAILKDLSDKPKGDFEIILDYKGMRRPPIDVSKGPIGLWTQYEWQLLTYAELRQHQVDALPVIAGVLVYINELHPTRSDLILLKRELRKGTTDIVPAAGLEAEKILKNWHTIDPLPGEKGSSLPQLPFSFRLNRALRLVNATNKSISNALSAFDKVVKRIEKCLGQECYGDPIMKAWERNSSIENTCVVCDSRTFCPDYQKLYATTHGEKTPRLPGIKVKP